MTLIRKIALFYVVALTGAAAINYIPGLTDAEGRAFGVFALDIYDDSLHLGSAVWAAVSAWLSHRAARNFLLYFGLLYFFDGALGLVTGSGFLDLGIINYGIQNFDFLFKIKANTPHILLGGFALFAALKLDGRASNA